MKDNLLQELLVYFNHPNELCAACLTRTPPLLYITGHVK